MSCPFNPYKNEAMKQYFDSLPPYVQETLMQCGPEIQNEQELRDCASKMMNGGMTQPGR